MSNYINKVLDKDQNEYPLRDERLPNAAPEDSGKGPVVNSEGQYELGIPAGGTKLYKHEIMIDTSIAFQMFIVFATTDNISDMMGRYGPDFINGYAVAYGPRINAYDGILTAIGSVGGGVYSFQIRAYSDMSTIQYIDTDQFTDTVTPL